MSVIKAKLVLSRDQIPRSRQDFSMSKIDQVDSSDSSIKTSSDIKQLVNIFREFVQVTKRQAQPPAQPVEYQDLEPRDRPIKVPLPTDQHLLSRESLERYMTNLCQIVWSRAFYYYSSNQLSFENTKIYSSQQILQNLARLCEKYNIQAKDFGYIDKHLQGSVLEYMLNKYPMTLCQEINRNLNNSIREIDQTDSITNNFLYKSNVVFKLRENGQYNDLVMRTINQAINKIESKVENKTVYQRFQDKMTLLFESITDYEWMNNREDQREEDNEAHWMLSLTLNNTLQKKITMDENTLKNEYAKMKEKQKSTYQEKVKQYTHYKIGKKLPESTRLFTEQQIKSHRLKIETPQILRILTKWCEELERKFQCTGCFEHYIENVSLGKSALLSMMMSEIRDNLSELIKLEKAKIQQELAELASNNFYMQSQLLMRKLMTAQFSQIQHYERISAQFSIDIVNNLHSYIIAYLNRLIHGLLVVFKKFQQLPVSKQLELPTNASIITFQVMDLIRCKCSSKEKEILKIYYQIIKQCEQNQNMELVRVVNRLKKGTNDILINIKYRNVLCEIQLAVTNKNNTFLEYSNAFNHYLYQLKRSVFGPLTQLCGIWKNLDSRFNIYEALQSKNQALNKDMKIHNCKNQCAFITNNRPFICSVCNHHYFHNKFIKKHLKCRDCDFWECARCQIERSNCKEILLGVFQNQEIVKKCKKNEGATIPNYGICVYIESQEIVIEPFRKYNNQKLIEKIMGIKNKSIYQIYDTSTEKLKQKFMSKFLIFEVDEEYGKGHIKISNEAVRKYLTEEKFKHILAKSKDTVHLNNENLSTEQLQRLCKIGKPQQKNRIKNIELIGNKITTCNFLANEFKNVIKLELSKNRITDFSKLKCMKKLQKVSLNENNLGQFPQQICDVSTLKELSLNQNSIKSIPSSLSKCSQLSSLQIAFNKLSQIPSFIFELRNLSELSFTSNFVKEIPQQIQFARRLRCLSIQNNYIRSIPRQIQFLLQLQRLNLSHNKISDIPSLAPLQNLKHLNLRHNDIKNIDELLNTPLNIREIDLSYNQIKVAEKIDNFNVLRFLNLSHNQLTIFPIFTRSCSNLKHLLMSNNKIAQMNSLQKLISLEELQLNDNLFEEVHPSISRLSNLLTLYIEGNHLKTFSNIQLDQAIKLNLKKNQIAEVKGLHMKYLEEIDISENEISNFQFNFLPKLKKINLNINQLKTLQLSSYVRLSVVQAARNQLINVPTFHSNNQLKFLNLEHNYIEQIPRPMFESHHINALNLSNNKIKVVPKELLTLSTIKQNLLNLQNNPLQTNAQSEICEKCDDRNQDPKVLNNSGNIIECIMESQTHPIQQL